MPSLVWKTNEEDDLDDLDGAVKKVDIPTEEDVDIDLREVYLLFSDYAFFLNRWTMPYNLWSTLE